MIVAACVIFGGLFTTTHAFVPPTFDSTAVTNLYGVKSVLKRGFNKVRKPFRKIRITTTTTTSPQEYATSLSPTRTRNTPAVEYPASPPDWYEQQNNHNGVAVLERHYEKEQEHAPQTDKDHLERLVAAFHSHSPAMFHEAAAPTDTTLSHVETNPMQYATHHPSENIEDEEEQDTTAPPAAKEEEEDSVVRRRRLNFQSDDPLYILPSRVGQMSRLETEFRDMLAHFSNYSMRDLYALKDPRMRTLVHGVAASGDDKEVYRAFEILFEDLLPLRVAGRLVFKQLRAMMDRCIQEREEQIEHVAQATALDPRDIEEARIVFFEVASKLNHDVYLTPEQLTATRMFYTIHRRLNVESPSELVQKLDRQGNRKIGLEDFLIGLHQCAEDQCEIEQNECYAIQVVHELLEEIDAMENPMEFETKTSKIIAREAKELKYVMRYDEMVEIFRSWKTEVPGLMDKSGRKWEVVQGCFVGAENQKVVDALRIVYVDYSPLRVAAEFILSLASSLLGVKAEVKR